jgi:nicotinate-nucleotide pyrophosphorylase (carboxylating)
MSSFQEPSDIITLALTEDLGSNLAEGDVTSRAFIPRGSQSRARIITRMPCVVSGIETAREVFHRIDPSLKIFSTRDEGALLSKDAVLMEITGSTHSILSAERTALNFLGRLCGIATLSRRYAEAVAGTGVKILDTRKTTPGWRFLEKQAVKAGGCVNHRMGLYDAVLVKDNHLAALGNLSLLPPVIARLREEYPGLSVEIEADTLPQVKQLLSILGIDVILLDNMSRDQLEQAVAMRGALASQILLEASGGITLEALPTLATTGVDRISVGALTHSAPNADLSLELEDVS